jgi:hypothetical protein
MTPHSLTRREFLWQYGGGIALASLLGSDGLLANSPLPVRGRGPGSEGDLNGGLHHRAKAKRVVQLFMSGAASQCDTFDYKPELIRCNGQPFNPGGRVELFQSMPGHVMQSPWRWRQHGQCGKWISDLLPHIASCVDDIAFIPSMVSRSNVHGPATFMQNTGFVLPGFPSLGAWINYGLGSMTQNLPAFVVIPDSRGFAPNGPANWSAAFLPASVQGTTIRPSDRNAISHDKSGIVGVVKARPPHSERTATTLCAPAANPSARYASNCRCPPAPDIGRPAKNGLL